MTKFQIKVQHEVGLHARPASLFVKKASSFQSNIQIRNVSGDSEWVDAKSILGVLTLGVERNHIVEIKVEGSDEEQASDTIKNLIEMNFQEEYSSENK